MRTVVAVVFMLAGWVAVGPTQPARDLTIISRYDTQNRQPLNLRTFFRENPRVHLRQWEGIGMPAEGSRASPAMAAFSASSIPVFVVFLFCQKIILRGIILPQLK